MTEMELQRQETNLWLPEYKLRDWDRYIHSTMYKIDN